MNSLENQCIDAVQYLSVHEREEVLRTLERVKELHEGQMRESGEPYVEHPIETALYLTKLEAGKETLIAALLHDAVEDEHITLDELEAEFGPVIRKLVDGVTKLSKVRYEGKRAERQVISLRKMLLTANEDLRVIFIKLADRWHNISTIGVLRPDKRQRIALETLDIYVPFARLLGLWELKSYLEQVCFPIAYPRESTLWSREIAKVRSKVEEERRDFIERLNRDTPDDIHATLTPMTDYDLFRKFQGNINRLNTVSSVDSCLVHCTSPGAKDGECYRILGDIHQRFSVRVGTFRDFISAPTPNGYRALHTTIFLSKNHQLRLRIQTQEMYDYATHRKFSQWLSDAESDIYRSLSSLHQSAFRREEYVQNLQDTVLSERINIFTTEGEIVALPRDATGVDFAFILSPDFMSGLAALRVNGELQPPTHTLKDGDTVELVLVENGQRELQTLWLEKMKSTDAREKLKSSLRASPKLKRMELGREILEIECRKRRIPHWLLFSLGSVQGQLVHRMRSKSFEELLEGVGVGTLSVNKVIDEYRKVLGEGQSFSVNVLKFFGLLPQERVLNLQAKVVAIEIRTEDRPGMIYDITKVFAEREVNISSFRAYAHPPKDALYRISLEVKDYQEFSDLYDALLTIPNVKNVLRKR